MFHPEETVVFVRRRLKSIREQFVDEGDVDKIRFVNQAISRLPEFETEAVGGNQRAVFPGNLFVDLPYGQPETTPQDTPEPVSEPQADAKPTLELPEEPADETADTAEVEATEAAEIGVTDSPKPGDSKSNGKSDDKTESKPEPFPSLESRRRKKR